MGARHTLPRRSRLKRRRLIRALFDRSRSDVHTLAHGCIRLVYRMAAADEVALDVPVQVGFIPGKRIRTATARNRIKRLLRETYRVHQHPLHAACITQPSTLTLMILFRGTAAHAAPCIRRDLPVLLKRLAAQQAPA